MRGPVTPDAARPLVAVVALFSPVVALMLSGAVRAALGVPLGAALAVSVVAVAGAAVLARKHLVLPRAGDWPFLGAGAIAAAALCALLWNPDLGPLATVGGGDAGNHVSLMREFVTSNPKAYEGFVVFHAVAHWLGAALGWEDATGFALAFYLVVVCVFVCAAAAAAALVPPEALRARRIAAWAALFGVLAAGVLRVFGPWLHYQQADGFYAHVFALVPLLLGWLGYAAAQNVWVRAAIVVAWAGLLRFTYGLNLGDAMLCGAAVLTWEALASGVRSRKRVLAVGALGLTAGAVVAYLALAPLRLIEHGAIVAADVRKLFIAQGLMIAFLALSLWRLGALRDATARVRQRLVLFPLLFGAVSLVVQVAYVAARWPQRYYFLKYSFLPVMWTAVACAALLPLWLTRRNAAVLLAVPAVAALVFVALATGPQWFTFKERAFRLRPYEHVQPLTDAAEVARARQLLSEHHARSGGVLEPSWPRGNFLNATLGSFHAFETGIQRFRSGEVVQTEGTCVFWLEGGDVEADYAQVTREVGQGPLTAWRALTAARDKSCEPHRRAWRPEAEYRFCFRCGPPEPGVDRP